MNPGSMTPADVFCYINVPRPPSHRHFSSPRAADPHRSIVNLFDTSSEDMLRNGIQGMPFLVSPDFVLRRQPLPMGSPRSVPTAVPTRLPARPPQQEHNVSVRPDLCQFRMHVAILYGIQNIAVNGGVYQLLSCGLHCSLWYSTGTASSCNV
jgi:hypothetical protein